MPTSPQAPECARAQLEEPLAAEIVAAAERHVRRLANAARLAHYEQLAIEATAGDAQFDAALGEGRR